MRIAMVCPYSVSRPGGVQGQVQGLARSLRRLDHQVVVFSPSDHDPVGETATGDQIVGRVTTLHSNGSVVPLALSPAAARRTSRLVRRGGFDVAHLHEPMAPSVGYACLLSHPVPMVGTFHRSGDSAWYSALRPLAGWAGRRIDARVAVSVAARATAQRAMGGRYEVLFNGVEIERFTTAVPTPGPGLPTIVFLGRHEERKGLPVLLAAFEQMTEKAELWIAGTGGATQALERAHPESERRHWLGLLDEDQVAARLAGADLLCAPSLRGESFGMVLLEALAAGCAVVASDLPGYREAAGGHATLVPPGDAAALAGALDAVVAEAAGSSGRCAPGALAAGLAHAREWSMDRLARRYVELYEQVATK